MNKNIIMLAFLYLFSGKSFSMSNFEVGSWSGENNFSFSLDSSGYDDRYGDTTSKLDFESAKIGGVYFAFEKESIKKYEKTKLSIGKSYENGIFIDNDWYSQEYAESEGMRNTNFSSTESVLEVDYDILLERSTGKYFANKNYFLGKIGLGVKNYFRSTKYMGYGAIHNVESYGFNQVDTSNISNKTPVIEVINNEVFTSLNILTEKKLNEKITINIEADLSPINFINVNDKHILNGKSLTLEMLRYGAKAKLSATYKINKKSEIKIYASRSYFTGYSKSKIKVNDSSDTIYVKDISSETKSLGISIILNI